MRVACLELERFRRNKERESAVARVRQLDSRFREIESEQAAILNMLGKGNAAQGAGRPPGSPPETQRSAFKLKY
jgi:hypothetical protein